MHDSSSAADTGPIAEPSEFAAAERDLAQARDALLASLQHAPWAQDFFHTLRQLEALHPHAPRLGKALRPGAEPVRLGQDAELDFAPAGVSSFQPRDGAPPRLGVRFFGLFGPMGPMPLHLTEYVRERAHNHGDPTLARFADIFHHRALLLFYRAWAQAQPACHLDRPSDDAYSRWVGALSGHAGAAFAGRDRVPDVAKRHHAGTLARGPRHAEGLEKMLADYFRVPVRLQSHVGHWMPLRPEDRTRLLPATAAGRRNALGVDAVAGNRVWDRQYRFRLLLGPLSFADYQRFLPGQDAQQALRDWVRQYVGLSLSWDVKPVLRAAEVPRLQLGRRPSSRLGWTTWLGARRPGCDRADLRLLPERPNRIRTERRPP